MADEQGRTGHDCSRWALCYSENEKNHGKLDQLHNCNSNCPLEKKGDQDV